MKTSEYKGFSHVFKFTLRQTMQTKSFQITFLIMMVLSIGLFSVMNFVKGMSAEKEGTNSVEKLYVINESGLKNLPYEKTFANKNYSLTIEETQEEIEQLKKEITKENEKAVILTISFDEERQVYSLKFSKNEELGVTGEDVKKLAEDFSKWFDKYRISVLDIDEDVLKTVGKGVAYELEGADNYLGVNQKEVISEGDYSVVYFFLMLVYLVTVLAAGQVAGKVAEEKSNRVVEYLMTSVRPRALILGKVVSLLLLTVGEIVLVIGGGLLANKVSAELFGCGDNNLLSSLLSPEALENLNPFNGIFCVLVLAVGIYIYGLLSGLFGASVSRTEDLQQGLKTYNLLIIAAFILSMLAAQTMWTSGIGGLVTFCLLCPFTSVMLLPGALIIGKVSLGMAAASFAIQVVTAILIMKIVETVYESIIVMNGNVITVKQMVEIFKGGKKK